jgi:hypothetical protein
MSGIFIVVIIVCLIGMVGLGFAVLTLHSQIENLNAAIDRLTDLREEDLESIKKDEVKIWERIRSNAFAVSTLSSMFLEMRSEYAGVKKDIYGTADATEFSRLKTTCYETLPKRIQKIEDFLSGKPEAIRIDDEEKLEELRKALKITPFDVKEENDDRNDV